MNLTIIHHDLYTTKREIKVDGVEAIFTSGSSRAHPLITDEGDGRITIRVSCAYITFTYGECDRDISMHDHDPRVAGWNTDHVNLLHECDPLILQPEA